MSAITGALVAVMIAALARSNYYILAGLAPLFPTFALFAHLLAYKAGGLQQMREVALFGIYAVIPYLAYVITLYFASGKMRLEYAVSGGLLFWFISAGILYLLWNRI
ncbi:MAG: GlpM family protein [Alphaproteobacteria bacterium]